MSKKIALLLLISSLPLWGQTLDIQKALRDRYLDPVKRLHVTGEYERAANAAQAIVADGEASADYFRVLVDCLVTVGMPEEAIVAARAGMEEHPDDIHLAMRHYDVLKVFGRTPDMPAALNAVNELAKRKPAAKRTALDMVALGRAALAAGADPQLVIGTYLNPARKKDPKLLEATLALGELALEKGDYQRAAKEFEIGLKEQGEHPALRVGMARAFAPSDRPVSLRNARRALEMNSRHIGALMVQAEHLIAAEGYDEAVEKLDEVLAIDDGLPQALALRSAISLLYDNDPFGAASHRTKALDRWQMNPEVDHLIGKVLSKAYRFREGAQYQREALAMQSGNLKVKMQLAHDLMRLGETEEAWKLAADIRKEDGYNTQAHNLGLLERQMSGFHVQRETDFILRMPLKDWQVYGKRALEILRAARSSLPSKYGLNLGLSRPTTVEFFPSQQDFAIRTFGSLGGQGLLGVCFGTVITMNSPGSLAAGRNNWEATLWHEYCHVVTLGATHNRMPRWLSEGISVYEETRKDASWGMPMTSEWKKRILNKETPPTALTDLSEAFLNAEDGEAVMFAYFLSSRAVEYLTETYGNDKFQALLRELASGTRIKLALEHVLAPAEKLNAGFAKKIEAQAAAYAPRADFEPPKEAGSTIESLENYLKDHPTNVIAWRRLIAEQMDAKNWHAVLIAADKLHALEPEASGSGSALWLKAKAYNRLENHDEELKLLRQVADASSDATPVFLRLMEVEREAKQWVELQKHASRVFALNPFLPEPTESLALAAENLGQKEAASGHYERLLIIGPPNPTLVRYKLAELYRGSDRTKAVRYLLDALVDAPRFKEAHQLLLDLQPLPN
ncbi:MAG: tetratricopeptide repeat protein [Verrucomicrobiaceae bacterium]|nr:tetratricopeptide repeat protein [Verrucomicrobiaceae bacterium]